MKAIIFVGAFTIIGCFLAYVLNTVLLLRIAKYASFLYVPTALSMWLYEGIKKSSFILPGNFFIVFLGEVLVSALLTFLLIRIHNRKLKYKIEYLDRWYLMNFNLLLLIVILSYILGGVFILDFFGIII